MEYIKSTGVAKDYYIGLLGYESLYISPIGKLSGIGALKELALAINNEASNVFKKILVEAKEIYLQSKNIDQDKPYQFLSFIRLFSKF